MRRNLLTSERSVLKAIDKTLLQDLSSGLPFQLSPEDAFIIDHKCLTPSGQNKLLRFNWHLMCWHLSCILPHSQNMILFLWWYDVNGIIKAYLDKTGSGILELWWKHLQEIIIQGSYYSDPRDKHSLRISEGHNFTWQPLDPENVLDLFSLNNFHQPRNSKINFAIIEQFIGWCKLSINNWGHI